MKQEKDQTQILLWTATASAFLFVVFKLNIMSDIGISPYLPWIVGVFLLIQLANHVHATWLLRKKSPNYTNDFYLENGRMIFGNILASALVLELNVFNYEQFVPNLWLEFVCIPFAIIVIFFSENSRGGFLSLDRIYFPKKWDQIFKSYGVTVISIGLMIVMWLPVMFRIPISAPLWIWISTILLKESVIYTNKYNHLGWCVLLEALLVVQFLTLGYQGNNPILVTIGILTGFMFLFVYMTRIGYEKILVACSILIYMGASIGYFIIRPEKQTVVRDIQYEIVFFVVLFILMKLLSLMYRKWICKTEINKYSYEGIAVEKPKETVASDRREKPKKVLVAKATVKSKTIKPVVAKDTKREAKKEAEKQAILKQEQTAKKVAPKQEQKTKQAVPKQELKVKEKGIKQEIAKEAKRETAKPKEAPKKENIVSQRKKNKQKKVQLDIEKKILAPPKGVTESVFAKKEIQISQSKRKYQPIKQPQSDNRSANHGKKKNSVEMPIRQQGKNISGAKKPALDKGKTNVVDKKVGTKPTKIRNSASGNPSTKQKKDKKKYFYKKK